MPTAILVLGHVLGTQVISTETRNWVTDTSPDNEIHSAHKGLCPVIAHNPSHTPLGGFEGHEFLRNRKEAELKLAAVHVVKAMVLNSTSRIGIYQTDLCLHRKQLASLTVIILMSHCRMGRSDLSL